MRSLGRDAAVVVGVVVLVVGTALLVLGLFGQLSFGPSDREVRSAAPAGVPDAAQQGTVVRIVDGDTLHLSPTTPGPVGQGAEVKVRLLEIDTPESQGPRGPRQCYADEATDELTRLLPEEAEVWFVPDRDLRDRYGRTLLYAWNADGTFVNLAMVRRGFAKAVLFEPNDRHIATMRAAQRGAEKARRGLWGACSSFGAPAR